MTTPLIQTKGLKKYFSTPHGLLHAVDDVNISIEAGQTLGVVGESGCGKSTLGRVILRLIEATSGEVLFNGENILDYTPHQMKDMRKQMQIVFQDPFASLNPRMTVSELIAEPMKVCGVYKNNNEMNASSTPTRTRWTAAAVSASASPARWRSIPNSLSATSPFPLWTSRSRHRF